MIEKLQRLIDKSNNAVFFGGAGVSTESNIPDFRGERGILKYTPEEIISHNFFLSNPEEFYEFYKEKMMFLSAKPNNAHKKLAVLEEKGKIKSIITQNIDGLHQIAGSKNVLELHGSIHRNYCMKCGKFFSASYVKESKKVPICDSCSGIIKPDVVLYQEGLNEKTVLDAVNAIANADLLIIGGTSLVVYPAAGFIN